MSAKMGRPTDNPKNIRFEIRLDNDTNEKLEKCSSELNLTKTDVIRKGIDLVEKSIKNKTLPTTTNQQQRLISTNPERNGNTIISFFSGK